MPTYTYFCQNFQLVFEKFANISDYQDKEICPQCGYSRKVSREFAQDAKTIHTNIITSDNEITIGQLASRNTKKMTRDEKIDKYYEHNKYKWEGPELDMPKGMTHINKTDKDSIMKKIEEKF